MDATVLRYAFIRLLDLDETAETFRSFPENDDNRIMIWQSRYILAVVRQSYDH